MIRTSSLGLLIAISGLFLAGCAPSSPAPPAAAPSAKAPVSATPESSAKPQPLSPPVKVRVGFAVTISDAGLYIGYERGYFKEEGLEVELTPFGSLNELIPALATGLLEVGGGGAVSALFNAIARDVPLKIVADKGQFGPGGGFAVLLVRKDLVDDGLYKGLPDLKGKRIGLDSPTTGGINHIVLDAALKKAGLTDQDVQMEFIARQNMLGALTNKAIDAAVALEPAASALIGRGVAVKVATADEVTPNMQAGVLLYAPQFIEKQPEAARRFMVGYLRGVRDYNNAFWKNQGREEVVRILATHTVVKDPAEYDRIVPAGVNPNGRVEIPNLEMATNWWFERGFLTFRPDLRNIIDNQYVDYALKRLGEYR